MMDYKKIEVELSNEEHQLIQEIDELTKKMDDVDPNELNGQLLDSLKRKALDSIAVSLGVSDILEGTSKNGLDLDKEYKNYIEWERKPANERSKEYKTKNIHPDEFKKFLNATENLVYNRDELTGKTFKQAIKEQRNENPEGFNCAYTGKFYKHGEAYQYEHSISTNEISQDRTLNYVTTVDERRKFANSKENLVVVGSELNQSLGKTKVEEMDKWGEKKSNKDKSKTNKEYHSIDEEKMKETLEKSKAKLNDLKESKKVEYGIKTKGKIITKNVAKGAAKAAVGKLLSITVIEIVNEYQKEEEREFKERVNSIKTNIVAKAKEVFDSFKNHSIHGFITAVIDALINGLSKIAKNIFKFIKTAFSSILKAIKTLFDSSLPMQERINEALKILGVAVLGMIGIALEEIIEKAMVSALPFTAAFAGYISPVLSGLIVGIGSVLVLQAVQKYQNNIEIRSLRADENSKLDKKSRINLAQAGISDVKASEAVFQSISLFDNAMPLIASFANYIEENLTNIKKSNLATCLNIAETQDLLDENNSLINKLENQ